MKISDSIKGFLGLGVISVFFYLLTHSLISEYNIRKKCYTIEFGSGRVYLADSVHIISQREVSFVDVHSKRNVTIRGQFVISTPIK